MRTIAIPFVGQPRPRGVPSVEQKGRALWRAVLAALDRRVPPHDPSRGPERPPQWYRFPPF